MVRDMFPILSLLPPAISDIKKYIKQILIRYFHPDLDFPSYEKNVTKDLPLIFDTLFGEIFLLKEVCLISKICNILCMGFQNKIPWKGLLKIL